MIEIGTLFKALIYLCKTPDRQAMLGVLKLLLPLLHVQSRALKHGLEIVRFLVHQYAASPREAYKTFYRLFINTNGKYDSHIPVDMGMEHIVKRQKTYVIPMCSGRTENNVERHTSAMCGINTVAHHYDEMINVLICATRHKTINSIKDEKTLIQELRCIKPFKKVAGRLHVGIGRISESGYIGLNIIQIREWLTRKQNIYSLEISK